MSIIETIYPEKLKPGDTIGVAAPAGSFNKDTFRKGVSVLEKIGFNVHLPEEIMLEESWFAGGDKARVDVLHRLFQNPEIKAVVCARGGYGSMRLLDKIDFDIIGSNPKLFAGFSDISVLLSVFAERAGLVCYHAPVVTSLADADELTVNAFKKLLTVDDEFSLIAENGFEICGGTATGKLYGGNLTTLNHLAGTGYFPDLRDSILMLEDISEAPYKIDRMITQMKLAGVFEGLSGIGLGTFEECGHYDEVMTIFEEAFFDDKIPVVAGFPFGHSRTNLPFPVGSMATLSGKNASLVCKRR